MTTVVREDLTTRTALSKSALVGFDLCQTKAWYEAHDRRKMLPSEKVSFGSALDAAIEVVVIGARENHPTAMVADGAVHAIEFIETRDGIALPTDELSRAVESFAREIVPQFDWSSAETQVSLWADIPGLGETNGHPDILLGSLPLDVKSSAREKGLPSLELGLYALLLEHARGVVVPEAIYLTWVRQARPRWVVQRMPVTSEVRRWTWEHASRYVTARSLPPETWAAIAGGPKIPICGDCQYSPANGGPCGLAYRGGQA